MKEEEEEENQIDKKAREIYQIIKDLDVESFLKIIGMERRKFKSKSQPS